MEREGEFGNEEPELSNVLGVNSVQVVGGGEGKADLMAAARVPGLVWVFRTGQKERPVFAVVSIRTSSS